jgi:hypothetical protein
MDLHRNSVYISHKILSVRYKGKPLNLFGGRGEIAVFPMNHKKYPITTWAKRGAFSILRVVWCIKGKGKVHPRTGREGTEVE